MVALVGGGGKTTTLYALAREARTAGRTVIVTTTTHMMPHPALPLTDDPDPEHLRRLLEEHGILTLGRFLRPDKLSGVGSAPACRAATDVTLVEADGARLRPLKAPAGHEPVIPPAADAVLAVAGMDCVGRPIGEVCHRPERVCALLGRPPQAQLCPADVAAVLTHPLGGRKGVLEHMAFRCVLNKADTPERRDYAEAVRDRLAAAGVHSVITQYRERERGGACLF